MNEDNKTVLKPVKVVKVKAKTKSPEEKTKVVKTAVPKQIKPKTVEKEVSVFEQEQPKPNAKPQAVQQAVAQRQKAPKAAPVVQENPGESVTRADTEVVTMQPTQRMGASKTKTKVPIYNKWWYWLALAAIILGVVALAKYNGILPTSEKSTELSSNVAETTVLEAEEKESGMSMDENLLTVELTVPASFFEDETKEEIEAAAKENGMLSCTVNEDGSVTYKMTKAKRRELLKKTKEEIDNTIVEYTSGGENAPQSFRSITYNSSVTQFDVRVDREAYENSWFDSMYALGLYMMGGYYQIFDGVPNDQVDVVVNFIDDATGETIESGSLKNAMENTDS